MGDRLRFLVDTNIIVPLEDAHRALESHLANFIRLAGAGGHQLVYHPATVRDVERDADPVRRSATLARLAQFTALDHAIPSPWNTAATSVNDACDNDILYALECDAAHALITEDRGLHRQARERGIEKRVHTIQAAEEWLRRLHEPRQVRLPNIEDLPLHCLTLQLRDPFFDSLRNGYKQFDTWFRDKARTNRRAWVHRPDGRSVGALCIYAIQADEVINDEQERLSGTALKLCTFKVGESLRGRKIGELFLKAAFRFASQNECQHVFIHAHPEKQAFLISMLEDFGFHGRGHYRGDAVLVKAHPTSPPGGGDLDAFQFSRDYYPHFRYDPTIRKFLVPIQPRYHEILFPDYSRRQGQLFDEDAHVGNAIKLAYVCRANLRSIRSGDLIAFYRTEDMRAVTSIGVVERSERTDDAARIMSLISRRTVYGIEAIRKMADRPMMVMLFRLARHLDKAVPRDTLTRLGIAQGTIQSIRQINDKGFQQVVHESNV
nr:GNAT family N-acetyltransferase [Nitrosomonas nitrosa]